MEILIIEDDENIADAVREILSLNDYHTDICYSGLMAIERVQRNYYDLILLDIMLPEMDGFQVMEKISGKDVPVIFITAKQNIGDKLMGFSLGAEDYIVKPFNFMELLARVEVVLRRNKKMRNEYSYRDVKINLISHHVVKNGIDIEMTPKEFELLVLFVKYQDLIMSREQLVKSVGGGNSPKSTRTIDNHIGQIRKKLDWKDVLISIPRIGYKLKREKEQGVEIQ